MDMCAAHGGLLTYIAVCQNIDRHPSTEGKFSKLHHVHNQRLAMRSIPRMLTFVSTAESHCRFFVAR